MPPHRVSVPRAEYDALIDLRDITHERLKVQHNALRENYDALDAVNKDQVARLSKQTLTIDDLQRQVTALEARAQTAEAMAPVRSAVSQPMFKRTEPAPATAAAVPAQPLYTAPRKGKGI